MSKISDNNMRTISSSLTFFYKFFFTTIWIGGFGFGSFALLLNQKNESLPFFPFLVTWIIGSFFLYWGCARLKHVKIDANNIYISNFLKTNKMPLQEIERISENCFLNIHPIWISFKTPTDFGRTIMFMPKFNFLVLFFCSHPTATELCELAKDARKKTHKGTD